MQRVTEPRTELLTQQANFRFPAGLKERLKEAAEKSGRALNAEVVRRLELSLERDQA